LVALNGEVRVVSPAGATFSPRICLVRLTPSPGSFLPCARSVNLKSEAYHHVSATSAKAWTPICPALGGGSLDGLVTFELPSQDAIVAGAIVEVSLNVWQGNQSIFTSKKNFEVEDLTMADLPVEKAFNLTDTEPFFSAYPIITTRGREGDPFDAKDIFFIQYLVKPKALTRGDYTYLLTPTNNIRICKVEVKALSVLCFHKNRIALST